MAIRGSNLASLAGEFSLELDQEPLKQAGLFAITGPTGAGKSTLLDALCVALFDKTPRLNSRGGVLIGRETDAENLRLGSNDVRALLRRGAGTGFAEVEFLGRDQVRYRTRWSVRRARCRPDGRFQPQTMEFEDLERGKSLTGTKSETLAAIEDRLGLSFDQFRRSSLLAQGDFAAFLRADCSARAELLERMTGTSIYGAVSRVAYRRAMTETRELANLIEMVEGVSVLSDEARNSIEDDYTIAKSTAARLQIELNHDEQSLRWHQRRIQLADQLDAALRSVAQSQQRITDNKQLEKQLRDIAAAAVHRQVVAQWDQVQAEVRQRQTELASAESEEEKRYIQRAEAGKREKILSARIAMLRRAARSEIQRLLIVNQQQSDAAQQWIDQNTGWKPVANEWTRWRSQIDRTIALRETAMRLEDKRRALSASVAQERSKRAECQRVSEVARKQLDASLAASELALRNSDAETVDHRARQQLELVSQRERLDKLLEIAAAAKQTYRMKTLAKNQIEQARAKHKSNQQEAHAVSQVIATAQAKAEESQQTLLRMRQTQDLAQHRSSLTSGDPCPLCGSVEHPWAQEDATADAMIVEQEQRVKFIQRELQSLRSRHNQLSVDIASSLRDMKHAELSYENNQSTLEDYRQKWRKQLEMLEELILIEDPESPQALESITRRRAALAEQLKTVQAKLKLAEELKRAANLAAGAVATCRSNLAQTQTKYEQVSKSVTQLEQQVVRVDEQESATQAGMDHAYEDLANGFVRITGWKHELQADPRGFLSRCATQVNAWNRESATLEENQRRRVMLERELRDFPEARHVQSTQEFDSWLSALADHPQSSRLEILEQEIRREEDNLLSAAKTVQQTVQRFTAAMAKTKEIRANHRVLLRRRKDHRNRLDEALHDSGFDESRLRELLDVSDAWLKKQGEHISSCYKDLERDKTIVLERQTRLSEHEQDAPACDIDGAKQAVRVAKHKLAEAMEQCANMAGRLRSDDQARKSQKDMREKLAERSKVATIYKSISDLIGSADGKRFRVFAQSLTLEYLLHYANEQLSELSNRYQLARVPGFDLDLQIIDRDLGDEVRSVNSLSGGESFLVSLALALGLSSLSSQDTRVDSLLIDEGFGTLDSQSFDTALAALDALQASGRKVGVISHVAGLAERVGAQVVVSPQGGGRSIVRVAP